MDPFLEHPQVFPDFHDGLITYVREFLQAKLPPPYIALIGSTVYVDVSERYIEPDVHVHHRKDRNGPPSPQTATSGNVLVAAAPPRAQPVVIEMPVEEKRQLRVEIRTNEPEQRLVTLLEVLRISNKTSGANAFDKYKQKQKEALLRPVHLVEIDLLRAGKHATAIPRALLEERVDSYDYHICVSPYDRPNHYLVYPIKLAESLPTLEVPLLPGDAPVALDLQAVFNRCYDAGPYHRWVRYATTLPVPSLDRPRTEWVLAVLREKGFRPPEPSA
jgi:hypothetical protein